MRGGCGSDQVAIRGKSLELARLLEARDEFQLPGALPGRPIAIAANHDGVIGPSSNASPRRHAALVTLLPPPT